MREIAKILGVSPATVSGDLRHLRRWELEHERNVLEVFEVPDGTLYSVRLDFGQASAQCG